MKEKTLRRLAALEGETLEARPLSLMIWDAVAGAPQPEGWDDPDDPENPVLRIEIVEGTEEEAG